MPSVETIARLPQTIRNLQRLRDILAVINKYGFESIILATRPDLLPMSRILELR